MAEKNGAYALTATKATAVIAEEEGEEERPGGAAAVAAGCSED